MTIQRSTFVTAVAWTAIVISGLAPLIAILWAKTVFSGPEFIQFLHAEPQPFLPFATHHFRLFFVLYSLAAVSIVAISIALFKRRNWARLCFVGLMLVGIVWQLASLGVRLATLPSMRPELIELEKIGGGDAGSALIFIGVMTVLFALGMTVLFGWISKRLMSVSITAEFRR